MLELKHHGLYMARFIGSEGRSVTFHVDPWEFPQPCKVYHRMGDDPVIIRPVQGVTNDGRWQVGIAEPAHLFEVLRELTEEEVTRWMTMTQDAELRRSKYLRQCVLTYEAQHHVSDIKAALAAAGEQHGS